MERLLSSKVVDFRLESELRSENTFLDIVLNKRLAGFPFVYFGLGSFHIDHMFCKHFGHMQSHMMGTVYFVVRLRRRHLDELHLEHSL